MKGKKPSRTEWIRRLVQSGLALIIAMRHGLGGEEAPYVGTTIEGSHAAEPKESFA